MTATDLTKVFDHPARIIDEWVGSLPRGVEHQEIAGGIRAREVLESHEKEHNVTFAALDNDAWVAVKEEYDRYVNGYSHALGAAINDLLGLED